MNIIESLLPILEPIVDGLGRHFGENCEIIIHDYSKPFDSTVVAIANGELTGRSVGSGGTNIGLKLLSGLENEDGRYNYTTQTTNGKIFRSSTIYIKDENGKPVGSFCLNLDVTDLLQANSILKKFINLSNDSEQESLIPTITTNVDDMLHTMILDSISSVGVPVSAMTREQKMQGILHLSKRGALRIKNSANIIATYYDVSKYTVYNYMNENSAQNLAEGKDSI